MRDYYTIMSKDPETCYICGATAVEWHHIIHGTKGNKILSEDLGLMAPLCRSCHHKVHHRDGELDLILKTEAQRIYLIEKFGRCYI